MIYGIYLCVLELGEMFRISQPVDSVIVTTNIYMIYDQEAYSGDVSCWQGVQGQLSVKESRSHQQTVWGRQRGRV